MNPLNHVAIIMDGNGRWGLKNKNSRNAGHKAGLKVVEKIIKETLRQKVKFLTLYAFSTENWKRPHNEIDYLFNLLETFLKNKIDEIHRQNIKFKVVGNKAINPKIFQILNLAEKKTSNNTKLQLNLALNYGSRNEIINTVKIISKKKQKITEKNFTNLLQTGSIPDPDLMIRTGNTKRLSNFLLWQLAYSEIFFEKKLWPEFNEEDYRKIILKFKKIKRNFGNIL